MLEKQNNIKFNLTKNQVSGFTLIELLIVLTLISVISGVAAPNFWNLFIKTQEQQALLEFSEQIDALRIEAWNSGKSIFLPKGGGSKWPKLPAGWQAQELPALRLLATGITNGGKIKLSSNNNHLWQIEIRPLDGKMAFTPLQDETEKKSVID